MKVGIKAISTGSAKPSAFESEIHPSHKILTYFMLLGFTFRDCIELYIIPTLPTNTYMTDDMMSPTCGRDVHKLDK